jgi:uncharacterized radical SAM superfamily Fe-S cluster-containing enzyme
MVASINQLVEGSARRGLVGMSSVALGSLGNRALLGALKGMGSAAWAALSVYERFHPGERVYVSWASRPILRREEKTFPTLGLPRWADSLCPADGCYREIPALLAEEEGMVTMRKTCPEHGEWFDIIYRHADFFRWIESLYPGDDVPLEDLSLFDHGSFGIRASHGAVYNIDLTNRCDMHCTVCFANAWDAHYVYEPTLDQIKRMLDAAASVRPKRQASIQFTGGEPTVAPTLPEAIRYAKSLGFYKCQIATNGINIAQSLEFAQELKEAGLDILYLQFDGTRNEDYAYTRQVANMFDVKVQAIEHARKVGLAVVLVPTLVRTVNDDRVGDIARFAVANADVVAGVSYQPVSITGRIEEAKRLRHRYTLSDLAFDLKAQAPELGTEPVRDWVPLSATGPLSDLADALGAENATWGSMKCGCHPNCGTGMMALVNLRTRAVVPIGSVLDIPGFLRDAARIAPSRQPKPIRMAQIAAMIARNLRPRGLPPGIRGTELLRSLEDLATFPGEGRGAGLAKDVAVPDWRIQFFAGMHFQDKYDYQFDRTRRCIIHYLTPEGNISFCAYNTGADYRDRIEMAYNRGSNSEWFRRYGRNRIYARMATVPLPEGAPRTPLATKEDFRRQAEAQGADDAEGMLVDRAKTDDDGVLASGCVAMPPKVEVGGCGPGCGSHATGGSSTLLQIGRKPSAARDASSAPRGGSASPVRSL